MPKKSPVRRTPAVKTAAPKAAVSAAIPETVAPKVEVIVPKVEAAAPAPQPALPAELIENLRNPAVETAVEAAEALAKLGDARAVPALVTTLQNADGYCHVVTRAAAAMALGRFDTAESIAALSATARDAMAEVSKESILALGELKAASAVTLLTEIVANADGYYLTTTRHAAVRALGRLKAASAKPVLTALATSPTEDAALTAAAREAIGQV